MQSESQFDDPLKLAALSLTLIQSSAWDTLERLSSVFLKERIMALDSHQIVDKLSLFVWCTAGSKGSIITNRDAVDNFGEARSSESSASEEADDLSRIRSLIFQFDPMVDWSNMDVFYRKWDDETIHAVVRFFYLPLSVVESQIPKVVQAGMVILHKSGADSWSYHDVKFTLSWEEDFGSAWFPSLEDATKAYSKMKAGGVLKVLGFTQWH
jgi:hypothetical protein